MIGILTFTFLFIILFTYGYIGGIIFSYLGSVFYIFKSKWRFLIYAFSIILTFLVLFGDEIISKYEVEKLERKNLKIISDITKQKVYKKNIIVYKKTLPDIPILFGKIKHKRYLRVDADSGELYFISDSYTQEKGWLNKFLSHYGLVDPYRSGNFIESKNIGSIINYLNEDYYNFNVKERVDCNYVVNNICQN